MNMAKPMAKSSSSNSKPFNWTNTIIVAIVAIMVLGVGLLQFLFTSSISGKEFCPQNFQYREFSYRRIPGTKIRITSTSLGTARSEAPTDILKHLKGLGPVTWQPMEVGDVHYPPSILQSYIGQRNADSVSAWGEWSANNALLAAELWPVVQRAAEKEMYFAIPELMRIAKADHTPASLQVALNESILTALAERCRVEQRDSGTPLSQETGKWVKAWADDIKQMSPTENVKVLYEKLLLELADPDVEKPSNESGDTIDAESVKGAETI